jgi:hypothetical protein
MGLRIPAPQAKVLFAQAPFSACRRLGAGSFPELGLGQAYLAQGDYDKAMAAHLKSVRPAAVNYFWLRAAMRLAVTERRLLSRCKRHSTWDFMILPHSMPARTSLRCPRIRASSGDPALTQVIGAVLRR